MENVVRVGYARVSAADQDLTIQIDALTAAGCSKIFSEKISGLTRNRPEFIRCMEYLREGDALVVTRIDRLARDASELLILCNKLQEHQIELIITEQQIDTTTIAGKAFFQMLAVFAELETNLRKERQMEGIRKALAEGKTWGRRSALNEQQRQRCIQLRKKGLSLAKIANEMGVGKTTVHRIVT